MGAGLLLVMGERAPAWREGLGRVCLVAAGLGELVMQSAWDDQVPAGFSGLAEEIRPAPHCCPERGRSQRPSRLPAAKAPGLIAIPAKGSKASRAHAKTPLVEAGQVRFARKTDSLIEEMLAFSLRGGVDDQVDAFCQEVPWIEARLWRGRGYGSSPVPMVFSR